MTLKLRKDDKTWIQVYGNEINNRLRRDKNLSEISDKAEARVNLELDGENNTTHFHDSRYLPKIEAEANTREAKDTQLLNALNQEIEDRAKIVDEIQQQLLKTEENINESLATTKVEINSNLDTLQKNLDTQVSNLKAEIENIGIEKKTITVSGSAQATFSVRVSPV